MSICLFYVFFVFVSLLDAKFDTCLLSFVRVSDYVCIHKDYVEAHANNVREFKVISSSKLANKTKTPHDPIKTEKNLEKHVKQSSNSSIKYERLLNSQLPKNQAHKPELEAPNNYPTPERCTHSLK